MQLVRRCALALLTLLAPTSLTATFDPDLASLDSVAQVSLPLVAVQKALSVAPRKDRPFQFAAPVATQYTLSHGSWDTLPSGERRWRLRVQSEDARSLSLHLAPFELPPSASMWVYDENGSLVHGPYRTGDFTSQGLWTPIVPQDHLVVEVRLSAAEARLLELNIAQAFHGYRDWKRTDSTAKAGACNIDVACPKDGVWNDEMRSTAQITVGNSVLCTGVLLNNVEQDLDPLFLTANHCEIGTTGKPAASVQFYFNYEASTCKGDRNGSFADTQLGSELLASDASSDFALLRMSAAPNPNFEVYYAGWNVQANAEDNDCGVSIHHPNGDEKAISFFSIRLTAVDADIDGNTVSAWRVARWKAGTTEAGSSGAGLWNERHEVIGVLSGGDASCNNRSGSDFYGRIDEAWNPPGSSASGQLKAHLDPSNSGRLFMPGRDPTRAAPSPDSVTSRACGSAGSVNNLSAGGGGSGGGLPLALLAPLLLGAAVRGAKTRA